MMMTEMNANVHKQHLLAPMPPPVKAETVPDVATAAAGSVDPLTAAVDFAIKQRLLTGVPSIDSMYLAYYQALICSAQGLPMPQGLVAPMQLPSPAHPLLQTTPMMPSPALSLMQLQPTMAYLQQLPQHQTISPAAVTASDNDSSKAKPAKRTRTLSTHSDSSSSPAIAPSPAFRRTESNSEFSTQPGSPSDFVHPSSPSDSWRALDADIDADSVDPRCHPNAPEDNRACLNCKSTSTPLWRRSERGFFLCNACGLYLRTHGKPRPPRKPRQLSDEALQKKMEAQKAMQNVKCGNGNCGTTSTTLWRKDPNGRILCNSCGLFLKLHGCDRPDAMRRKSGPRQRRKPWSDRPVCRSNSSTV